MIQNINGLHFGNTIINGNLLFSKHSRRFNYNNCYYYKFTSTKYICVKILCEYTTSSQRHKAKILYVSSDTVIYKSLLAFTEK